MLTRFPMLRPLVQTVLPLVGGTLLAWMLGRYIGERGFSYREIIVLLVLLGVAMAFLAGERGLQLGFGLWIWSFGIGYRTFELTNQLRLHPSELLLCGLAGLLVVQRSVIRREPLDLWIPGWFWLLFPFLIWGWVPGLRAGRAWDQMFSEFRDFLLFIPLCIVANNCLREQERWRGALLAFFATSTWVAGMGALEYFFPGSRYLFPGFISNPVPMEELGGFQRALYSFWGGPMATFVCALAVPVTIVAWHWWPATWQRIAIVGALFIQTIGIYVGGYRSMWLAAGFSGLLWACFRFGVLRGSLALLPAPLVYWLLPESGQYRFQTLVLALQGQPVDSSASNRWDLADLAWQNAQYHPLGYGWAGIGWSHSDFLQVAANLGVLAGIVFLGAYLWTLWHLIGQVRRFPDEHPQKPLGQVLLLSFISAGWILLVQGVQVLPQLVLPVWFVWVLVAAWMRQNSVASAERFDGNGGAA